MRRIPVLDGPNLCLLGTRKPLRHDSYLSPAAQVARMREFGVLCERAGGGEYFHACTEPFAERFFCEIVQRRGGYGALDAPARMASQLQPPAS